MDSISEQKILKLEKVEYFQTIVFAVIWLICFAIGFNYLYYLLTHGMGYSVVSVVLLYIGTACIFCQLCWKVLGKVTLTISNEALVVNYKIFSIGIAKKFKITNISNLRLRHDAQSSFYSSFGGIRTYGTTSALSFSYKEEEIDIKGNLSESDFALLKQWMKN
ncbi:MAG: hypothetical protein ACXVJB_15460 [Mucilaginibacter sp.]